MVCVDCEEPRLPEWPFFYLSCISVLRCKVRRRRGELIGAGLFLFRCVDCLLVMNVCRFRWADLDGRRCYRTICSSCYFVLDYIALIARGLDGSGLDAN